MNGYASNKRPSKYSYWLSSSRLSRNNGIANSGKSCINSSSRNSNSSPLNLKTLYNVLPPTGFGSSNPSHRHPPSANPLHLCRLCQRHDNFSLPSATSASSIFPAPPFSPSPVLWPTRSDGERAHLVNLPANREDDLDAFGNVGIVRCVPVCLCVPKDFIDPIQLIRVQARPSWPSGRPKAEGGTQPVPRNSFSSKRGSPSFQSAVGTRVRVRTARVGTVRSPRRRVVYLRAGRRYRRALVGDDSPHPRLWKDVPFTLMHRLALQKREGLYRLARLTAA